MKCPECGSTNVVKNGKRKLENNLINQTYRCNDCGFRPSDEIDLSDIPQPFIEHYADGSISVSKFLAMTEEDSKNPNRVLELAGFDPDVWKVKNCRVNAWNGQRPYDKGQLINHQVRLDVEPKKPLEIGFSDIKKYFDELKPEHTTDKIRPRQYSKDGLVLEVCLADLHNARFTVGENKRPLDQKLQNVVSDVLGKAKGYKFKQIYFVPLGDVTDADNMAGTTTAGTQQSLTMTPYSMLRTTADMLIQAIKTFLEIAPVRYIFIPGNHDELVSYAVASIINAYFRNDDNVTVNLEESGFKWEQQGVNIIAWTHGNIARKRMFDWLPVKARKAWSNALFAEVHSGHTNDQKVFEKAGQVVRYLPSVTDMSIWEEAEGYGGLITASASFVWDLEYGLQEQWFSNIV